jgi:cell division transport system permease protein
MNLLLFFKEGLIGLKRAKLSAIITIISICLSLSLIGIFTLLGQNLKDIFFRFYKEIEIEVFLEPDVTDQQISRIESTFHRFSELKSARFISRSEALQEFQKIFGTDISGVLDENPLPASFRLIMKSDYSTPAEVEKIAKQISDLAGIQEVIYQKEIISFIHKYFNISVIIIGLLAFTLLIVITILVFNTIRLTIYARRDIIQIMKLVGATNYFIKGPFIFEGMLQGLIGGGLSLILVWLTTKLVKTIIFPELSISTYLYLFIIGLGVFFGLVGSYFSVNKYLKYQ